MEEVWEVCEDWPQYLVSSFGRVWSKIRDREISISIDTKGYCRVNVQRDGVWKVVNVHRLVAFAFVDGYFEGAIVNHIDADKTNNTYTNLEWVTQEQNMQHAKDLGLITGPGPRFRGLG